MTRRAIKYSVQLLVGSAIICYLFRSDQLRLDQLTSISFSVVNVFLIILAGVFIFTGLCFMAIRLRLFLNSQDIKAPWHDILNVTLIGSMAGVILPGPVGGDLAKGGALWFRFSSSRGKAIGCLVLDRLVGLYSLFLMGTIGLIIMWIMCPDVRLNHYYFFLPLGTAIGGVLFILIFAVFEKIPSIVTGSSFWLSRLLPLLETSARSLKPQTVLAAILLSLINHGFVLSSFVVAAHLVGNPMPIPYHLGIDPISMVVNTMPITPGGIGLAEASFSHLYQMVGYSDGAAIGLIGRSIQYSVFMIAGLPAWLFFQSGMRLNVFENIKYWR